MKIIFILFFLSSSYYSFSQDIIKVDGFELNTLESGKYIKVVSYEAFQRNLVIERPAKFYIDYGQGYEFRKGQFIAKEPGIAFKSDVDLLNSLEGNQFDLISSSTYVDGEFYVTVYLLRKGKDKFNIN